MHKVITNEPERVTTLGEITTNGDKNFLSTESHKLPVMKMRVSLNNKLQKITTHRDEGFLNHKVKQNYP